MSTCGSLSSAIPAVEFHKFLDLPAELREEIWLYCLPERVCELDIPWDEGIFEALKKTMPCEATHTAFMNARPPSISRVCHESRSIAFKKGNFFSPDVEEWPSLALWATQLDLDRPWLDSSRDILHINWILEYEPMYFYSSYGHPLHSLAWSAVGLAKGGSIRLEFLQNARRSRYGIPIHEPPSPFRPPDQTLQPSADRPLSDAQLLNLEALKQLHSLRVVMRIVIVHSDWETAAQTGLFGPLGDAWVQIVDVTDESRIDQFYNLAQACESTNSIASEQDFDPALTRSMGRVLRGVVMDQFQSADLAAAMRPVIMFRLCTQMCNQRSDDLSKQHVVRQAEGRRRKSRWDQ